MGIGSSRSAKRRLVIDDRRGWAGRDWLAVALVSLGAGVLRLVDLARPAGFVFDEIFYARNACRFVIDTSRCGIDDLVSGAHPPLGNWIIGVGIRLFGMDEFGWRIASALAGTLSVVLLYLLSRRLLVGRATPSTATAGAFIAAALLAADPLHLVQSRVAMLDSLVTLFTIATVLFALLDMSRHRDAAGSDAFAAPWLRRLTLGRPWRLATGASLGAAAAVKWSGAYVALGIVALLIAVEVASVRATAADHGYPVRWRAGLGVAVRQELFPSLLLLGLVPLVVYVASYIGRIDGALLAAPWSEGSFWRGVADHQIAMLRFHVGLEGHHPYESAPWSWLLLQRPVAYSFAVEGDRYREVLAIGNPLTWWAGTVVLAGLAVNWARTGAGWVRAEPILVIGALATYLPWLILSGARSQVFIWYILPTIPFLCAALGLVAARAWGSGAGKVAVSVAGVAVLAWVTFFYPVLTAQPLRPDEWLARMWLTDCQRPGAPSLELPDDEISSGPPPSGWCWI